MAQMVKNLPTMQEISGLERSPGKENDDPLQYSCLENSMDRGAWGVTAHGVEKRQKQLSN